MLCSIPVTMRLAEPFVPVVATPNLQRWVDHLLCNVLAMASYRMCPISPSTARTWATATRESQVMPDRQIRTNLPSGRSVGNFTVHLKLPPGREHMHSL